MTIKIKVGRTTNREKVTRKIAVKKSLNGELMFLSHPHINVIVKPEKNKVLTFAKEGKYSDESYAAMKRLLTYLGNEGLIPFASVQGGNIYASLEGTLEEPMDERSLLQLVTFHIGEWLNSESSEVYDDYYAEEVEEFYLDPTAEDSTELGEVPQEAHKGVLPDNPIATPLIYRI
jgi:hypothetical protein